MIPVQPSASQKITARHLSRQAMLYVRQSTLHQVLENTESTARQYGLRERAIALGWEASRIVVIDQDLGQSGASVVDRLGFQHLVAEVGLGHVGLVMGLEVSRLARSSLDWHHLLEICTMTETLILDEDGLYDPATFNDRLLLGLKGTMSEAELHVLKARLRGGILHQAQRGALKMPLPIGLAYAEDGTVILDPDAQIQQALRLLFSTFKRIGSAWGTVRFFRTQGLLFPRHVRTGPHKGEIHWAPLVHNTARQILRNPRYAGAFCYGRTHTSKRASWVAFDHTGLPGAVAVSHTRCPFRIHHLGRVRSQPAPVARKSYLPRRRSSPRPPARRTSLAARGSHLRTLWPADDGALS